MGATKRNLLVCGIGIAAVGIAVWAYSTSAPAKPESAKLHPQRSVTYFAWDGTKQHAAAIQETAQYKALVASGLFDYATRLLDQSLSAVLAQVRQGPEAEKVHVAKATLTSIYENGFSVSISDGLADGPPTPLLTIVLHEASASRQQIADLLPAVGIPDEPQQATVAGRDVLSLMIPETPGFELSWWAEDGHLVVAAGPSAAERVIAVADGNEPNVTTNKHWLKYRDENAEFEVSAVGWLDFAALTERFGDMPLPINGVEPPRTINDFSEALGLDSLQAIGLQFGYHGPACLAKSYVEAPGPRKGLMSLLDQPLFTIDDLPPLPPETLAFGAFSLDTAQAWDISLDAVRNVLKLLPPEANDEFEEALSMLPQLLGMDLRNDLLDSLGKVHCVYSDPAGGPFGIGFGVAVSVKDAAKLSDIINVLAQRLEGQLQQLPAPVPIMMQRADVAGRQLITVPAGMFTPTVSVDKDWMVMALYPQSVNAFFLRQDGDLPKWEVTADHREALADLPKRFSSITIDDPRASLKTLYSFVPMINSAIHTAAPGFGADAVKAAELPAQEVVTAPLFPNVTMSVPGPDGVEQYSRQSLPLLPMPAAESAVVAPVLIALLLPAVQQARTAARRTQSKNNLKQLGLAMHNYYDVFNYFPIGTEPDTDLQPNKRFSFLLAVLPFLEEAQLFDALQDDRKKAWDDPELRTETTMQLPMLINPASRLSLLHATHYVGIAGVGEDAPELAVNDPRAGIFGYDRKTRFQNITDGTSNTIMMTETSDTDIPWAAGGRTLKSLTQEPYVNGPDGIGGPYPGGVQVLMADGSVHFISEDIDPEIMRRLAAMADGNVVGEF